MDLSTIPFVPILLLAFGLMVGYLARGITGKGTPSHGLSLQAWTRETVSDPALEAAAALGGARAIKGALNPGLGPMNAEKLGQIGRLISSIVKLWRRYPDRDRHVLWVDDHPENNGAEMLAFAALGMETVTVTTTIDAMKLVSSRKFSVIISDMDRAGDHLAGFVLLEALRQRGDSTPFVMYSGSASSVQRLDAKRRGALDCTDDPQELVRLVNQALLISLSRATD